MRILHLFQPVPTFTLKMKNVRKQFAVVLILVYFSASLFMQYSHQHILFGSSDGRPAIQKHTCGAIEIHRSLDNCRHCLLCLRDSTSNAILEFSSTLPKAYAQPLVDCEIIRTLAMGMLFSEPDRGPPSFPA